MDDSAEIINGRVAPNGAYPWMVKIMADLGDTISSCGGSLLDATHVLTAAHCVTKGDTRLPSVVNTLLGADSLSVITRPDGKLAKDATVAHVYVHPRYDQGTMAFDVAVLTLAAPLEAGFFPQLATEVTVKGYVKAGKVARAIGYGVTEMGSVSERLLETDLTLLDDEACRKAGYLSEAALCAGPRAAEATGTCGGDSGGPLLGAGSNTILAVGSYHLTADCQGNSYFVSLAAVRAWIDLCRQGTCPTREQPEMTTCNIEALDCKPEVAGCDTMQDDANCGACGTACSGATKCGWLDGAKQCIAAADGAASNP